MSLPGEEFPSSIAESLPLPFSSSPSVSNFQDANNKTLNPLENNSLFQDQKEIIAHIKNPFPLKDATSIFKGRNKQTIEKAIPAITHSAHDKLLPIRERIKLPMSFEKNTSGIIREQISEKEKSLLIQKGLIQKGKEMAYEKLREEEEGEISERKDNNKNQFTEFLKLCSNNKALYNKTMVQANLEKLAKEKKPSLGCPNENKDPSPQQASNVALNLKKFKKQLIQGIRTSPELMLQKVTPPKPESKKRKLTTEESPKKTLKISKKTKQTTEGCSKKKLKDSTLDVVQYENILEQQRIKTARNTTDITELFPQEFFLPDKNFVNANPFIDISNLASRKNTNELFLHLLSLKPVNPEIPVNKIPDSFGSPFDYLSTFKTLFLGEVTARIGNLLKDLQRPNRSSFILSPLRLRLLNEQINDFTYFAISDPRTEKKKPNEEQPSHQAPIELLDQCFDIKYARNYLVLITNIKEVKLELLRQDFGENGEFMMLGIIMNEKNESNDEQKLVCNVSRDNFTRMFRNSKNEWIDVNLLPLEKITTFLREYFAIQNLQYEEISKRIYKPKMSQISNSVDNLNVMSRFFESVQKQYNDSQYQAIKKICSMKEGITLLQGPPGTGKTFTLIGIVSGLYHYIKYSLSTYKRYIIICAPSNAAIDEIIIRIKKKGLIDENGNSTKPQLIRIGVLDNNPPEIVKKVSLEHMAQEVLFNQEKLSMSKEQSTAVEIRQMLDRVGAKIEHIKKNTDDLNNKQTKKFLDALFDKRRRLNFDYHQLKQNKQNYKEKYKQIVDNLLNKAEIICCTLSSAGSDKMEFFKNKIEALIVDEASQCTEPANIIPLQLSINKVILIGDPKQLPATTFSPDANKTLYNRSLFERFIDNGISPFFLDEQYRMNEAIREFPSLMFYGNRLKDGDNIKARKIPRYLKNFEQRNLFFVDLSFSREKIIDYSYLNEDEAILAMKVCKALLNRNETLSDQSYIGRIGLITPYKRQVAFFREIYKKEIGTKYQQIQVNTVDSFQGQEKDLILFSTVRSSQIGRDKENLIGFLDDTRRMNVALTRAKFVLLIIGHGDTLSSNEIWAKLLNHLITKGCYYRLSKPEEMEIFTETLMRNPVEIPHYFRRTSMIFPLRTLKKHKISETHSRPTLFEANFAKQELLHSKGHSKDKKDKGVSIEVEGSEDDEKSEEMRLQEVEDVLAHEDHSYLFKGNNDQKSNLLSLISKQNETHEQKVSSSVFNIFEIANKIMKF